MLRTRSAVLFLASALLLTGCGPRGGTSETVQPFDGITADETIQFVGTEPFWRGSAKAGSLLYTTPENPDGVTIAVRRFAGNHGIGLSGTANGQPFDMTVTQGECSDGMSDAIYPYTATLSIGGDLREGCAWTDQAPRRMP